MATTVFDTLLSPIDRIDTQLRDEARIRATFAFMRERSPIVDTMSRKELVDCVQTMQRDRPFTIDRTRAQLYSEAADLPVVIAVLGAGAAHGYLGSNWPAVATAAMASLGSLYLDDPKLRAFAVGTARQVGAALFYQASHALASQARR